MMRAALVCLATAASGSRLEIALQNYPRVHDRNLRAFERGDPAARIVRAKVKNGLGNREQALLSGFALGTVYVPTVTAGRFRGGAAGGPL